MQKSSINIDIHLDGNKIPDQITWAATDSSADMQQQAKAMMLAFWDGADKTAMRIDLWTKSMMVDEMGDFFFQTIAAMSDTLARSTGQKELAAEMKNFAVQFNDKFRKKLNEQQAN